MALAHAERSYPISARPKSPSHAKLYDQEKQRCFIERLRIEKERELQHAAQSPIPPKTTSALSLAIQSEISNLESGIPSAPAPEKISPEISTLSGRALEPQRSSSGNEVENNCNPPETPEIFHQLSTAAQKLSTKEESLALPASHQVPSHSHPSHNSHPPATPDQAQPSTPAPAPAVESQDDWEMHFDPTLPFEVHLKKKSPLARLPLEHQEAVVELLKDRTLGAVVELLARPLPYGLNLQTSPAALSRFAADIRWKKEKREREQKVVVALDTLTNIDKPTLDGCDEISTSLLKTRILANTSQSKVDLDELHVLVNCYAKLRRTALAELKLGLRKTESNDSSDAQVPIPEDQPETSKFASSL